MLRALGQIQDGLEVDDLRAGSLHRGILPGQHFQVVQMLRAAVGLSGHSGPSLEYVDAVMLSQIFSNSSLSEPRLNVNSHFPAGRVTGVLRSRGLWAHIKFLSEQGLFVTACHAGPDIKFSFKKINNDNTKADKIPIVSISILMA